MSKAKTMSELNNINGAFDKGNAYECVTSIIGFFTVGFTYKCNGKGIVDNDNDVLSDCGKLVTFKLVTPKEEAKTISELSNIDGAFNEGSVYECVTTSGTGYFSKGVVYQCSGTGIIDNDGDALMNGNLSTFKLVTPKEENKTMRTPFNLERALAGDKVVDKDGGEYNQFSVINLLNSTLINCYSVSGNCANQYLESTVNTILFMAPKMGKGFVNVNVDGYISSVLYTTRKVADDRASSDRIMCIDLSQFPKGYGL